MPKKPTNDTARVASTQTLVEQVGVAVRKMGAQSVITSRTIADRFDMNMTDLEVLDLIFLRGTVTAGDLANATGLTTGSVTALIDRLAKAGYVERCDDPSDRRKVLIRVRHDAIEPIKATYTSMQKRMFALWSTFEADKLEIVIDFVTRSSALQVECCKEIQSRAALAPAPAPLDPSRGHSARTSERQNAK